MVTLTHYFVLFSVDASNGRRSNQQSVTQYYGLLTGEANPGGGKDRVELFIERSKKNVMIAHDSLAKVIDILDLK